MGPPHVDIQARVVGTCVLSLVSGRISREAIKPALISSDLGKKFFHRLQFVYLYVKILKKVMTIF